MNEFRVIDLQTEIIDPEPRIIQAGTPEKAAELVLGVQLFRSGAKKDLRARVYWKQADGITNMVRLYKPADNALPK